MAIPLLLAGPIVRRIEPRSVTVWVALSQPGVVRIDLWQGRQKSTGPGAVASGDAPIKTGEVETVKLGERLHVALASTARDRAAAITFFPIAPPLQPGAVYSYDITLTSGGTTIGLREMGLLEDDPPAATNTRHIEHVSEDAPRHLALGYEKDWLPSFATWPAQLKDIRIAQVSCRKMNGPGTDAMSWLDPLIEEKLGAPLERIQQLFLTGDQIYSDEVPTCLLPMLHDLSIELMDGAEELPKADGANAEVSLASAPPMRRAAIVRTNGGFTTSEGMNHVLTFGEYAALYLLAWSPRVWKSLADEQRCYEHAESSGGFTLTKLASMFVPKGTTAPTGEALKALVKEKNGPAFKEERQRTIVFAATVAKVARVLANTPTYMIFDDHDVTDDWNINATWRNRVLTRPLGRAVARNALLAYTFFQAWGSDWRSFHDDLVPHGEPFPPPVTRPPTSNMKLLAAAQEYLHVRTGRPQDKAEELDKLFGLTPGAAERAKFHYDIGGSADEASGLLYQVRVMDSRTRRTFPFSTGVAPASLLGDEPASSLDEQLPKAPRRAGTEFVLVVASTPVLGPELLERMLVPAIMQGMDVYRAWAGEESDFPEGEEGDAGAHYSIAKRTRGAMFADTETWPANERAQHELLNRLAMYERVVVLSGDVHYGTDIAASWFTHDRSGGAPAAKVARILQLTSSGARNVVHPLVEPLYRGYHWLNQWMFGATFDGFAWKDGAKLALPAGAEVALLRHGRMKEKPSLLPAYGWPAGTTIAPGSEPDWAWRISAVSDQRPDAQRGGPFEDVAEQLKTDLDAAQAIPRGIERARAAAAVHQKARAAHFAPLRELVFTNNVGVITFDTEPDGAIVAVHTLYSSEEKGFPEDEPEEGLVAARPLGDAAHVSNGKPNTVVRLVLTPKPEAPPVPHKAVL